MTDFYFSNPPSDDYSDLTFEVTETQFDRPLTVDDYRHRLVTLLGATGFGTVAPDPDLPPKIAAMAVYNTSQDFLEALLAQNPGALNGAPEAVNLNYSFADDALKAGRITCRDAAPLMLEAARWAAHGAGMELA